MSEKEKSKLEQNLKKSKNEMKQLEASNEQVHSTLKEAEDKIHKIKLELEGTRIDERTRKSTEGNRGNSHSNNR